MKSIAVVGSGISGISAAWLLSQDKEQFKVTLYEKEARLGGHTNTVTLSRGVVASGGVQTEVNVDTGFIVFNQLTYPNFLNFLKELNVPYESSDMSFAVSVDRGAFEWSGQGFRSLFAQKSNILNPRFYLMIFDVLRFNATATDLLRLPEDHPHRTCTIGDFLSRHLYSQEFVDHYLIPMTAAIWSSPADATFNSFPAETLIRFMHNHCLLQILDQPQWYTVTNGSVNYIEKIKPFIETIKLDSEVVSIKRISGGVEVTDKNNETFFYDAVILAGHADESFKIISELQDDEKSALEKVSFSPNRAVLHSDISLMPVRKDTWASWNYLTTTAGGAEQSKQDTMCLTYWMNRLQNIAPEKHGNMLVTMNPLWEPEEVYAEFAYTHPFYNLDLVQAQKEIRVINENAPSGSKTLFAGAWLNYGFHEDGLTSGLVAASLLGANCPFDIVDSTHLRPLEKTSFKSFIQMVLVNFFRLINLILVIVSTSMIQNGQEKKKK